MNKKKILKALPLFLILSVVLVSAGLIIQHFTNQTTINNMQPLQVDGDGVSEIIVSESGLEHLGDLITLENIGIDTDYLTAKISSEVVDDEEGIDVSYVGELELTKKDTATWEVIAGEEDNPIIRYTIVGDTFEVSGVPDEYTLIYYKDGVVGLEGRLDNPQPAIEITSDIGSLPQEDDANLNANYSEAPDFYEHKTGAKLWAVPNGAILEGNVLDWSQMREFYYETDLIRYFNNANGEINISSGDNVELYPLYKTDINLANGTYIINNNVTRIA